MLAHGFLRRKLLGVKIELLCASYPLSPEPCHRLGELRSLPAATLAQARGKVSRPAPVLNLQIIIQGAIIPMKDC